MRVGIAGGGPAGLYLALLLARSGHRVRVVERNPPDATYGWGVVFSEGTLAELRDADYPTYVDITERFVRWTSIDVRHRGVVTRSVGQGFSAISRRALLGLLQDRCRQLGVELRFGEEVVSVDQLGEVDLVVAADGVWSRLRASRAYRFGTTQDVHSTRYAWFGTDLAFEAFTFIFEETPYGLFQVHGYPYEARASTFIVECTEEAWQEAGLDQASEEESLAFCEKVFADHLAGHRLASNRSDWIRFVTLGNRTWHDGRMVLVGDAAHTAHFSIGSGTKLAMEGAVSLHKALLEHLDDLEAAFALYELDRQPPVARFQQAARDSSRYFERVARYLDFEPERFAFNLLTRSGRVTHLDMERRDPALTLAVDRLVAGARSAGLTAPRPAVTSWRLGGLTLGCRVVLEPVTLSEMAPHPGLVVTPELATTADGRIEPGSPGLYGEAPLDLLAAIERVRSVGGVVAALLSHAGRRGATRSRHRGLDRPLRAGGWPLVSASPIPYTSRHPVPAEASLEDLARIREAFAAAARKAVALGAGVVMVDAAHGYLLGSFLSPLANLRTDRYGGSLDNRLRFPLEVVAAVGEAAGGAPVAVRISTTDWAVGGTSEEEAVEAGRALGGAGVGLVEVSGGGTVVDAVPDYRRLYLVGLADRVRNEASVPVVVRGGITTLDDVDTIVAAGRADLAVLDPGAYRREVTRPFERGAE